jgi:hypothetical protein
MQEDEPIAERPLVKTIIARCFDSIAPADILKFRKKFGSQRDDEALFTHTLHELVLGAFLCREGMPARTDWKIENETPDWSIVDGSVKGIIELVNVHAAKKKEQEIEAALQQKGSWAGWSGDTGDRLYDRIQQKAVAYRSIREAADLPYIVVVFGSILSGIILQHVEEVMKDEPDGLFKMYPTLSGLMFVDGTLAGHRFRYIQNPSTERPWSVPTGVMDVFR